MCTAEEIGKPVHQDDAHDRPNAVRQLGLSGAIARLNALAAMAAGSIPACPGSAELKALIKMESQRLLPKELPAQAA